VDDLVQRKELGAFLRSRRETTDPCSVGLKLVSHQRRTPGLRREELAQLSGVSVTWYTWLEQGRDISVSRKVIDSLAQVLKISGAERAHLYVLAGLQVPSEEVPPAPVDPTLVQMVNALSPYPTSVINLWWDVLVYNEAFNNLLGGPQGLPRGHQNLLHMSFTTIRDARLLDNWESIVDDMVGQLRNHVARYPADPRGIDLVEQLSGLSPEFSRMWRGYGVARFRSSTVSMHHPRFGALVFNHIKLATADNEGQQLVVWLPANAATRQASANLGGRAAEPVATESVSAGSRSEAAGPDRQVAAAEARR
jgi:transcriptional regulator with XRE-family HTH domain